MVGAGLAGVSTAFELASLGCSVSVFECAGGVAERASFAGAGLTAPWLPDLSDAAPAFAAWRWQRWRASKRPQTAAAAALLAPLGLQSQARLAELRRRLLIDDEAGSQLLVLLAQTDAARPAAWRALGWEVQALDAAQVRQREPGLSGEAALTGGVLLGGGAGNARLHAQALRVQAQRLGVEFRFHTSVRSLRPGKHPELTHEYSPPPDAPRQAGVPREAGDTLPAPPGPQTQGFDAVVLCNGLAGLDLLTPLGLRLPLAATHEASVTAPLRLLEAHPELGPQGAVLDLERGCSIARIGQRVRVAGGRHISRRHASRKADFEALHRALQHWFAGSVLHQQVQHWQGRRAVVADGLPLLGASGLAGVWLNLSPAPLGWGLSSGSAEILAQQIAGQTPALDLAALDARRLA